MEIDRIYYYCLKLDGWKWMEYIITVQIGQMEMDRIYYYCLGWMDGNGWNIP